MPALLMASLTEKPTSAQETSDALLANLAQVLAHRLRGLITSIEGFTDLLADTLATPEQRELALRVFESTASIERILSELQWYSRPLHPMPGRRPLRTLLQELLVMLEENEAARVALDLRLSGRYQVRADVMLLRQALFMLLKNALEATGPAGVVQLRVLGEPRSLRFEVWNEGWMPPEVAEQIFVPFFTTKAQNLGIGLPIARRIAEAHGGTVYLANNDPDAGICMALILPQDDEPAADGASSLA
ncbi:hypothetical protein RmaAA338_08230 [Rhodothermus marinus]|nr:hypothetical protein RmaAA338_08230 [Rhodothermus marinus]